MYAIEINSLWKKYRVDYKRQLSIKDSLLNLGHKKADFWALQDISLKVKKGESVGIIGSNGSGKSTLLRIILGIIKPNLGAVRVNGSMAGLLELGSGFHTDLTGRENIYLNGALLGFRRKEIHSRIDSIIDFAAIGKFIDAPVRTYSAGMSLRLGFAIAVHSHRAVLLIDEVLNVGDEAFQKKCLEKIKELKHNLAAMVLVSHDLNMVEKICQRVILMDKGRIIGEGVPARVRDEYLFQRGDL